MTRLESIIVWSITTIAFICGVSLIVFAICRG
jgi:hypothetical protein